MRSFFQPVLNCLNKRERQQNYIQILYLGHRFRSSQECCEHQAVPTQIAHKAPRNQSNECLQDQQFSTKEVNLSEHIFEIWIMHFRFCLIFSASEIWASHGPRKIYSTWRNVWGIPMKQKHYIPLIFWNLIESIITAVILRLPYSYTKVVPFPQDNHVITLMYSLFSISMGVSSVWFCPVVWASNIWTVKCKMLSFFPRKDASYMHPHVHFFGIPLNGLIYSTYLTLRLYRGPPVIRKFFFVACLSSQGKQPTVVRSVELCEKVHPIFIDTFADVFFSLSGFPAGLDKWPPLATQFLPTGASRVMFHLQLLELQR